MIFMPRPPLAGADTDPAPGNDPAPRRPLTHFSNATASVAGAGGAVWASPATTAGSVVA
jgi:hypothetical protein